MRRVPDVRHVALTLALGACATSPYRPTAITVSPSQWETFLTCARTLSDGSAFRPILSNRAFVLFRPNDANSSGMIPGGERIEFRAVPAALGLDVTSTVRRTNGAPGDQVPAAPSLAARTLRQQVDQQCLRQAVRAASASSRPLVTQRVLEGSRRCAAGPRTSGARVEGLPARGSGACVRAPFS